tara:strand:+ start:33961 stop:37308 length:3348 start_codon:yes stop_codon:yes gene_type:complete
MKKKIIFITDKKENIDGPFKSLVTLIRKDENLSKEQKDYLHSKVALIYSKEDAIYSLTASCFQIISDSVKTLLPEEMKKNVDLILEDLLIKHKAFLEEKTKKPEEQLPDEIQSLIREVYWQINKLLKPIKDMKNINGLSEHAQHIISILFPADFFIDRKIFFLTTKKALYTIAGCKHKSVSLLTMENNIIFIDEFDAQKKILDDSFSEVPPFLLDIHMSKIYNNFQLMNAPKIKNLEKINDYIFEFKDFLNGEVFRTLNPQNAIFYKNEAESKPLSLFYDGASETNLSTSDKVFRFKIDRNENKNHILAENLGEKEIKKEERFTEYLQELNKFEKALKKMLLKSIEEMQKHDETLSFDDSLWRILSWFNLTEGLEGRFNQSSIYNRMKQVLLSGKLNIMKSKKTIIQTYFEKLSVYKFPQCNPFDQQVNILHYNIMYNSHVFLANLCNKNKVVGLSATINTNSNIKNFDLDYLKSIVEERFYSFSKEEYNKIKESLEFRNHNLPINVDILTGATKRSFLENQPLLDSFKFGQSVEGIDRTRLQLLEESMLKFINSNSRYMVCFLSRSVSSETMKLMKSTIEKEAGFKGLKISQMLARDLKEVDENENKKLIKEIEKHLEKEKSNKYIIFTTYQTASAGLNLQRKILKNEIENEDYKVLSESYNSNKIDIDSVYLDTPTGFLLEFLRKENGKEAFNLLLLKSFRILKELEKEGNISYSEYKSLMKLASRSTNIQSFNSGFRKKLNDLYEMTDDFSESILALVRQVIGRMVRTNNRSLDINIYVAHLFVEKLKKNGLINSLELETKEMSSLIDEVNKYETNLPQNAKINNNMLKSMNKNNSRIQKILKICNNPASDYAEKARNEWSRIRRFMLMNGVYFNQKDLDNFENIGLRFSGVPWLDSLSYSFNMNNGSFDNYKPLTFGCGNTYMDEKYLRLDLLQNNELIKESFKESGFCLTFDMKNSNMAFDPLIVNNIYKGALGEEIIKIYFEKVGKILLEEPDSERFEFMDYIIKENPRIGIDAKYWKMERTEDKEAFYKELSIKMKSNYKNGEAFERVAIINVFDQQPSLKYVDLNGKETEKTNAKIALYSGILNNETGQEFEATIRNIMELVTWLKK